MNKEKSEKEKERENDREKRETKRKTKVLGITCLIANSSMEVGYDLCYVIVNS